MKIYMKLFTTEEGTLPGGRYQILVKESEKIVHNIVRPTMKAAQDKVERLGYIPIKASDMGEFRGYL